MLHAGHDLCSRLDAGEIQLIQLFDILDDGAELFREVFFLVVGNLNIPRRKSLTDYYGETVGNWIWDRFTVPDTPTHGSWLNQAEIEISLFARQCLGKRRIPDLKILQGETRAWNRRVNRDKVRINWRFDRKTARRKFGYKKYHFKRSRN